MPDALRHPFLRSARPTSWDSTPGLRVRNAASPDEAELFIYDEIGPWGISAQMVHEQLRAVTAPRIALHVNSPGGDVFDAVAIYNLLRQHPALVTSTVDSIALSAASVVILAADRVLMARHSQLMIHDAWGLAMGNAEDLRQAADFLARQSDVIAGIYAERGESREHWRALMAAETWFTAEEAVAAGLADAIADQEAVENRFDLSIFRNAPRPAAPAPAAGSPPPPPSPVKGEGTDGSDAAARGRLVQERLRYEHARSLAVAGR